MILMGGQIISHIILFLCFLSKFPSVHGLLTDDPKSLDTYIYNQATETLSRQRTGKLLNVSLPSNFSGIQASVMRTRSGTLWQRGVDFSSIYVPPGVVPFPFVKRVAFVYQNLGNWSSYFYQLPNYSLLSPVIGFTAYDATNLSRLGHKALKLGITGDPIVVKFSRIVIKDVNGADLKCVRFGEGGSVQFKNLTKANTCLIQSNGHFSVVIPSSESTGRKNWEWWLVGIGVLLCGLILLVVILVTAYKLLRGKTIEEMEEESEIGVAFDMKWIGKSKMPSAAMLRTQPDLEHEDIP